MIADLKQVKLAPSEILWEDQLNQIERLLQTHKLIFVRGKPGVGKTTLLKQMESICSGPKLRRLEFREKVDTAYGLASISKILGAPYTPKTEDLGSELAELTQHCQQTLNSSEGLLLIDNISHIHSIADFMDEFLRSTSEVKLIASCDEIPALDPMHAMDCGFVDLDGFTLLQTRNFLQKSQMRLEDHIEDLSSALFELCQANPSLIKWTLAPLLFSREPLSIARIAELSEAAKQKRLENIVERLDPHSKQLLSLAAFVDYSLESETKILSELDKETQARLQSSGFILGSQEQFSLAPSIKGLIKANQQAQAQSIALKILERLNNLKDLPSIKERISQLTQAGKKQEAGKLFSKHYRELLAEGQTSDFLKLSDSIYEYLDLAPFIFRRYELSTRELLNQSIFETDIYIMNCADAINRSKLMVWNTLSLVRVGRRSDAKALCELVLSTENDSEQTKNACYPILANIHFLEGQLSEAQSLADQFRFLPTDQMDAQDQELYFNSLARLAVVFEDLGDFEKALDAYLKGRRHPSTRSLQDIIFESLNISNTRYRIGQIDQAVYELKVCREDLNKLHLPLMEGWARYDEALHFMNTGQLQKALDHLALSPHGIACTSHSKNVGLHLLLLYKMARFKEVLNFPAEIYLPQFSSNNAAVLYMLKKLATEGARLETDLNLVRDLDTKHSLRISLSNAYLEKAFFSANSLSSAVLKSLWNENEKSSRDFYIKLETKCLLGLHYLLNGEALTAKKILEDTKEAAGKVGFEIWRWRSEVGLGILEYIANDSLERLKTTLSFKLETFGGENKLLTELQQFCETPERLDQLPLLNKLIKAYTSAEKAYLVTTSKFSREMGESEIKALRSPIKLDLVSSQLKAGQSEIDLSQKPILRGLLSIFLREAGHPLSKEELISRVWMEAYNPLYHDSKLYTNLKRLRQLLQSAGLQSSIQNQSEGYIFIAEEDFILIEPVDGLAKLSARQRWIIDYSKKNGAISRSLVERSLKISSSLAGSELKALVDLELIGKSGNGKATLYQLRK